MKKIGIYLIPVLALGIFTSCEEDPFKGIPQSNPQEELMKVDGVQVATGSAISGTSLDLNSHVDGTLQVISVTEAANLPEGANISFTMDLASKEDFSDARTLDVVNGSVSANEWSDAFRALLGRSPKAKTNYVRFAAYVNEGDNVYRLGDMNTYFGQKSLEVTPIDLGIKIESAYYLIGTANGWNPDAIYDYKFNHSDADVFDDPVFTLSVEITQEQVDGGGWWWKVVPQSNVDKGNVWDLGIFGVPSNGDTSLSGYITDTPAEGSSEVGAGCIMEAGKYKIVLNMEDGTYSFENNSSLYCVGDGTGWGFDTAQQLFAWGDGFEGFTFIQSMVKFTNSPDWDHGDYGMGDAEGTLAVAGGNITVEAPGLYYAKVNLDQMTYSLTNISSIGMIGDFNGWDGDVELTPNENFLIWTGVLTLDKAGGWKFRMNKGWDINLGGTPDNLVPNGDNISLEAGSYIITLDLTTLPLTCTIK